MSATRTAQEAKSLSDLHLVVREALSESLGGEVTGPLLRTHTRDPLGRNWECRATPPQSIAT